MSIVGDPRCNVSRSRLLHYSSLPPDSCQPRGRLPIDLGDFTYNPIDDSDLGEPFTLRGRWANYSVVPVSSKLRSEHRRFYEPGYVPNRFPTGFLSLITGSQHSDLP